MTQKKYIDIERCKEAYANKFVVGESIVIQEKIDGSNAAVAYDVDNDVLVAFSRRQTLSEENTLNGFYNWVQSLPVDKVKEVIGDRYIIFGEWMTKHSIKYPDDVMKNFYMFDVWDKKTEQYLPFEDTRSIFNRLSECGIERFVPIFYTGAFVSWEHTLSFVGKTEMGAEPCGEGIVIKRQSKLDSKSSRDPFYVKIVSEKFSEVHKSKPKTIDPEKMAQLEAEKAEVATVVTKRRAEKMLQKFEEDNIIPSDWGGESMKLISKNLPAAVFEDCRKEEPEVVAANKKFGKICAQLCMQYAREILEEKSRPI